MSKKRQSKNKGTRVVKGAAPKTGTKLTPERISKNYKSLNRSSESRSKSR